MTGPRYRLALRAAQRQCARHPGQGLEPFVPFVARAVAEQGWLATLDYARSVRQAAKGDEVVALCTQVIDDVLADVASSDKQR